jgi:predicted DNA-binding transcriptional regulator AlpA
MSLTETDTTIPRYIGRAELQRLTGLSDTTIWRAVQRGELRAPVRLTPGRVAWPETTIRQWLETRESR